MRLKPLLMALFVLGLLIVPFGLSAQELHEDYQGMFRGKVIEVLTQEQREIPGTGTDSIFQTIRAEVLEGSDKGKIITIQNDYIELRVGDKFYFNHYIYIGGDEGYGVVNIDRSNSLIFLVIAFVSAVVIFGGKQGIRSIVALVGGFLVIFYILLPGLLSGWNPILISLVVASAILFVAVFFTHGFNRESLVAYIGTMLAVLFTGLFAMLAVNMTRLSGFAADESIYLNFNTGGTLDFSSLLLGAIIIGIIGVLDDIAITQATVVSELYDSNPGVKRKEAYMRAMRVGREHVGALVNTLVLAYTGVSLPLLLYLYLSPASLGPTMNMEVIATEIVRAIVGSIGLILTVPIVTILAVFYLQGHRAKHQRHS